MFILNDKLFSEKLLKDGIWLTKNLSCQLQSLGRYCKAELNFTLDQFLEVGMKLINCDKEIITKYESEEGRKKELYKAWKTSNPKSYRCNKNFIITYKEQDELDKIEDLELRKIVFIILILYKTCGYEQLLIKPREIIYLSQSKIKTKEFGYAIHKLKKYGYVIEPNPYEQKTYNESKERHKDVRSYKISFAEIQYEPKDIKFEFENNNYTDSKNSVIGKWIIESKSYNKTNCIICGIEIKNTNNSMVKYCKNCRLKKERERAEKNRKNKIQG